MGKKIEIQFGRVPGKLALCGFLERNEPEGKGAFERWEAENKGGIKLRKTNFS